MAGQDDGKRAVLSTVSVGMLTAAGVFGLALWGIRRQAQRGDLLRLRVTHEFDPQTRALLAEYTPIFQKISDEGLRVRFGPGNTRSLSTNRL